MALNNALSSWLIASQHVVQNTLYHSNEEDFQKSQNPDGPACGSIV